MRHFYSRGAGSEFVIYRSDTRTIIQNVMITLLEPDKESIHFLRSKGFKQEAADLEKLMQRMNEIDTSNNVLDNNEDTVIL